jgi:16S rRNA processing protein RimM
MVVVGRFGAVHGVHGWLRVNSFTDPKTNLLQLMPWFLQEDDSWRLLKVESHRITHANILAKIEGYDTPEAARVLTNKFIGAKKEQLPQLPQGEYYWSDLEGLNVINKQGVKLGAVTKIVATGANDVLVVDGDRHRLIPYISQVVIKVDLQEKIILVDWGADY